MADAEPKARSVAWIEIASAIVLATAGLLTTWAGFQSELWSGVQASKYTESGALRLKASRRMIESDQIRVVEISLFAAWLNAKATDETRLADYYRERFPPNLRQSFDQWIALGPLEKKGLPNSPFEMPGYIKRDPKSFEMEQMADAAFKAGEDANTVADNFSRGNVMLAMAMFFAGIAQVFRIDRLRMVLLAVAIVAAVTGIVRVFGLPMLQPG